MLSFKGDAILVLQCKPLLISSLNKVKSFLTQPINESINTSETFNRRGLNNTLSSSLLDIFEK